MGAYHRKKAEYVVVGSGPGGATVPANWQKPARMFSSWKKGKTCDTPILFPSLQNTLVTVRQQALPKPWKVSGFPRG